jgi:hypothetical protein
MKFYNVEIGKPEENPEIVIIPREDPVPRETPAPAPTPDPVREPERVPA